MAKEEAGQRDKTLLQFSHETKRTTTTKTTTATSATSAIYRERQTNLTPAVSISPPILSPILVPPVVQQ